MSLEQVIVNAITRSPTFSVEAEAAAIARAIRENVSTVMESAGFMSVRAEWQGMLLAAWVSKQQVDRLSEAVS